MNLRKGSKVWVPDRDLAWVPAEVLESAGKQVRLVTASGKNVRISLKYYLNCFAFSKWS